MDFKGAMPWPTRGTKERLEIVRDILAFANTPDGGTIIIGVDRITHAVVGVNPPVLKTWDTTKVGDGCAPFGSPCPVVQVSFPEVNGKQLVMVEVAPFEEVPVVCSQEGIYDGVVVLRRAGLYIRTLRAQTVEIQDDEQMRSLIQEAVRRKGDHLLNQIRALVGVSPGPDAPDPYTAEVEEDLEELRSLMA